MEREKPTKNEYDTTRIKQSQEKISYKPGSVAKLSIKECSRTKHKISKELKKGTLVKGREYLRTIHQKKTIREIGMDQDQIKIKWKPRKVGY